MNENLNDNQPIKLVACAPSYDLQPELILLPPPYNIPTELVPSVPPTVNREIINEIMLTKDYSKLIDIDIDDMNKNEYENICKQAIMNSPKNLIYMKSPSNIVCRMAFEFSEDKQGFLRLYANENILTENFYQYVFDIDPNYVNYFPKHMILESMHLGIMELILKNPNDVKAQNMPIEVFDAHRPLSYEEMINLIKKAPKAYQDQIIKDTLDKRIPDIEDFLERLYKCNSRYISTDVIDHMSKSNKLVKYIKLFSCWKHLPAISSDAYLNAIKFGGMDYKYVPEDKLTEKMCIYIVSYNNNAINNIPHKFRTDAVYDSIIKQNPSGTNYISENYLQKLLIKDWKMIRFYREYTQSKTLEIAALSYIQSNDDGLFLDSVCYYKQHIPKLLPSTMISLIVKNYENLNYVPIECQTTELCVEAIKQNINARNYVKNMNSTIQETIVAIDGLLLNDFVNHNNVTLDVCKIAIQQNPTIVISDIITKQLPFLTSDKIFTYLLTSDHVCDILIDHKINLLKYTPIEYQKSVIQKNWKNIKYTFESSLRQVALNEYINSSNDETFLDHCDDNNTEIYAQAVIKNYKNLQHVPKNYQTEEMCIKAIEQNINAKKYARIDTPKIQETIVSIDGLLLNELNYVTIDVCKKAIKQNPEAIKFVPLHLRLFV